MAALNKWRGQAAVNRAHQALAVASVYANSGTPPPPPPPMWSPREHAAPESPQTRQLEKERASAQREKDRATAALLDGYAKLYGGFCDKCGSAISPGRGWHHLANYRDDDWDLCANCFEKLPSIADMDARQLLGGKISKRKKRRL